jgi:tetratricopeptide (TPR) repeat protein
LGGLLRDIGQIDRAWALHQQAHAVSLRRAPFLLRAIESQLAMDAFAAGQVEEGNRWLRSARTREPRGVIGTAWVVLAQPARAKVRSAEWTGAWDLAQAAVEQAISEAQRRRLPIYLPVLIHEQGRCLAALGRIDEAEIRFRDAQAHAQAAGLRPILWQTHAALAQLYQTQGRRQEAEIEHHAALKTIHELAASLTEPAHRDSFLASPAVQAVLHPSSGS